MIKFLQIATIFFAFAGCNSNNDIELSRYHLSNQESTAHNQLIGPWHIYCQRSTTSVTGEQKGSNACFLNRGDLSGYPLASVTSRGLLVRTNKGRIEIEHPGVRDYQISACGTRAKRHGVDGTALNGRSAAAQIEMLKSGKKYGKEHQLVWPYCTVLTSETDLTGFSEAYEEFSQVAKSLGYLR